MCRTTIARDRSELRALWLKVTGTFILATIFFGFIGFSSRSAAPFFYYLIIYLAGVYWAVNAFPELRTREKCSFWLMVPGSVFEKYLSRLFLSSVGFVVLFTVLYFVGVNVGNLINQTIFNRPFIPFIPLETVNIPFNVVLFIGLHSIFFAGGIYFKRYPIVKTTLFVLFVTVLLLISVVIIGGLALSYKGSVSLQNFSEIGYYWGVSVAWLRKFLLYCGVIIPIFSWIIGYFRLKKIELF